jgi:hypothetical protein
MPGVPGFANNFKVLPQVSAALTLIDRSAARRDSHLM